MNLSKTQRALGIGAGLIVTFCMLNIIVIGFINTYYPDLLPGDSPLEEIANLALPDDDSEEEEEVISTEEEVTPIPTPTLASATDNTVQSEDEPSNDEESGGGSLNQTGTVEEIPTPSTSVALECGPLSRQIEEADIFGEMVFDIAESGLVVLTSPDNLSAQTDEVDVDNRADLCVGIEKAGYYRITARVQANSEESNSFAVTINNDYDKAYTWHLFPMGRLTEDHLTNRDGDNPQNAGEPVLLYFEPGDHIISVHHREPGTRLDTLNLVPVLIGHEDVELIINPTTHYVSKSGSNGDGSTWESAWSELDQIDWDQINPGDTILFDGGEDGMIYETPLIVGKSGIEGAPITFKAADEAGHNGDVVIFGGRAELLPECGATSFVFTPPNFDYGIETDNHDWLVFEGNDWRGITIHGFNRSGVRVDRYSNDIVFRNTEITNNGFAVLENGEYYTDGPGVRLGGHNLTFERMIIHDNGQDAFQASWDYNTDKNFTVRQSWLYNGRKHSTYRASWNWCTHTDSFQIYEGSVVKNILFEEVFIGPGFTNSIILGSKDGSTHIEDLTLRDVVISKPDDSGLNLYIGPSKNILLENVTLDCQETYYGCLRSRGTDHQLINVLLIGADMNIAEDTVASADGTCFWNQTGNTVGAESEFQFVNNSPGEFLTKDNYALAPGSPCEGAGSRLTSIDDLFALQ